MGVQAHSVPSSGEIGVLAGLTADKDMKPGVLEYSQGDRISGKILRSEVAHIVAAALKSPAAVGERLTCCQLACVACHAAQMSCFLSYPWS